jgi:bifunctional UDP-N-acetylglucosamine pyrophosphorylase/glucosamine-1-phosphate N-acetyltransferase
MAASHQRICEQWMKKGVIITDPASTFIGPQALLSRGCVIEPFSFILGKSSVGKGSVIGPFTRLRDCRVGEKVTIEQSVAEGSIFKKGCMVGPWTRVRPGCVIGEGAHLGNFCEFKKARIGKGVRAGHLSYVGDASVGDHTNLGAGSITANYDGKAKHATRIGKRAFIGSGSILVAPVQVGDFGVTGAGAVLLKGRNVPKRGLALGLPARIVKTKP